MGTNFFIGTPSKEYKDQYFGDDYKLSDSPAWLYCQHIAKTSAGWVPLFQSHDCFRSIKELKELYNTGQFILFDEYGIIYTWDKFDERVLTFNGGISGVQKKEKIDNNPNDMFYDPNLPDYRPIFHCSGPDCTYKFASHYRYEFYKDPDGYEFTNHEFS